MSQIRHQAPAMDPAITYTTARHAADIIDDIRDHYRRMYREHRTTTPEHRSALNVVTELTVLLDALARDAGEATTTEKAGPF